MREEPIIAALIFKMGGEVSVSMRDLIEAEDLDVTYVYDEVNSSYRISAAPPPVTLEGELANEIENIPG